jgi:hypothetical protein
MPAKTTKQFNPEIDAQLYDELVAVAEQNGQTKRYVLEQALGFYLHKVVPSPRGPTRPMLKNFTAAVEARYSGRQCLLLFG